MFFQVSKTERITTNRNGDHVLQELNTHYGYYATVMVFPSKDAARRFIGPFKEYSGPEHPKEIEYSESLNYC